MKSLKVTKREEKGQLRENDKLRRMDKNARHFTNTTQTVSFRETQEFFYPSYRQLQFLILDVELVEIQNIFMKKVIK